MGDMVNPLLDAEVNTLSVGETYSASLCHRRLWGLRGLMMDHRVRVVMLARATVVVAATMPPSRV